MLYSKSTGGFYDVRVHGKNIPEDAVEITDDQYSDLLAGQAGGLLIVAGENGIPELQTSVMSRDEIAAAIIVAVQNHLNITAQTYGYDSIFSAVTYADEPAVPKFQAEGQALRAWRSLVWDKCYAELGRVMAGQREMPTPKQAVTELPVFEPPGGA